jgi:hypothetical protein
VLCAEFSRIDIGAIIARLTQALIMRMGRPPAFTCSFAHRRIQEYFVIRYMMRIGVPFDHEWVALDSQMRDASVLYVELASDAEAEQIARHCWDEIAKIIEHTIDYAGAGFCRALHCQRFLTEAFRARLPALNSFRADMARYVELRLAHGQNRDQDIITTKLAVETLGLLPEEQIPKMLEAALLNGDPWIRESAVNASRFLPKAHPALAGRIWRNIASMTDDEFERERTRLSYAFQLSSALSEISKLIKLKAQDSRNWRWFGRWIAGAARFWHLVPMYIYYELIIRRPPNEIAILAGAEGKALVDLERDKSGGLSGYRKMLASTRYWRTASVVIFLVISGPIGLEVWETVHGYGLGPSYWFAAVVYALESLPPYSPLAAFAAASLWIAPYFAGRSYPLVLPGEFPRRPWKDCLGGAGRWRSWVEIFVLVLIVGGVFALIGTVAADSKWFNFLLLALAVASGVGFLAAIASAASRLINALVRWARDRNVLTADRERLERFASGDNSTRTLIGRHFMEFETEEGREEFVRWLGAQRLEPTGEWPARRPPNLGDNASSLLARLEYRWRKFDR